MNGRTSARAKKAGKQTAQGGGEPVEQQIKALHAQLMEATLKHDPGFLEKYLADDYMAIRNDGKLTTKVQEIENYRSGATQYESIEIREATMRIHGNTAIYNSLNSIKATINGKPAAIADQRKSSGRYSSRHSRRRRSMWKDRLRGFRNARQQT
jgi:hypothetical protein